MDESAALLICLPFLPAELLIVVGSDPGLSAGGPAEGLEFGMPAVGLSPRGPMEGLSAGWLVEALASVSSVGKGNAMVKGISEKSEKNGVGTGLGSGSIRS